ncbi:MAG: hypothetical protein HYT76_04250 [Deltaproteobacteria bacterium]|nr:hypothetical protein [Deltaproteobacteria bacterium]
MSWASTIPGAVTDAARRVFQTLQAQGRVKSLTLPLVKAKGDEFLEGLRRVSATIFMRDSGAPYYVNADGARQVVRLLREPLIYPKFGIGRVDAFLLSDWLEQALTEHFSQMASILLFLGGPLFAVAYGDDREETKSKLNG